CIRITTKNHITHCVPGPSLLRWYDHAKMRQRRRGGPMTDAFRILPVSNDPDLEQQLRSGIVKRTNRDVLPAEVLASADVSTARVDLILGITGADIDRASRFLPEAATVAFTLADLAASLAQPRAEAIDPALLVTDVRAVPNASARSRTALIG